VTARRCIPAVFRQDPVYAVELLISGTLPAKGNPEIRGLPAIFKTLGLCLCLAVQPIQQP